MERLARLRTHLRPAEPLILGRSRGSESVRCAAGVDGKLELALQVVEQAVAQQCIPGASVAVMHRGKIVRAEGFGTCDPGNSDSPPFQSDTICFIASLTKPFTAAAAMLLVERGDLGLDDLVSEHLPDFAGLRTEDGLPAGHLVTVRDLMCHRSGLGRRFPEAIRPSPFFVQAWFSETLENVVDGISKMPLAFLPRQSVAYSNTAWYVLARIIEIRTGEHFGDFVRREIFGRLGLEDTGFGLPSTKVGRTAVCYSVGPPTIAGVQAKGSEDDDELSLVSRYDSSWDVQMCMPDGGLWASATDIARWATAFLAESDGGGGLLRAGTVAQMLTQQVRTVGSSNLCLA